MTTTARLAGFAAAIAVLLGAGALAGDLLEPDAPGGEAAAEARDRHADTSSGVPPATTDDHDAPDPVRGLAVADQGLRLALDTPELRRGRAGALRFRVLDDRSRVVRDFDVEHTKRMHLIVVRRDFAGFQHLHPTQDVDGSWRTPVTLPAAGSYRVFADFSHDGEASTLAADLRVDGAADLRELPEPASVATSDGGHRVTLRAAGARAGQEAEVRFTVTKDGRTVRPEPYLGAGGHLVALREGDLGFLHVHPADDDGTTFMTTFPSEGRYRLFFQFRIDGEVETVAFTQEVGR